MDNLDRARIRVDFNEMVEQDVVLLSNDEEVLDSSGERIALHEDLRVYLYMDDADEYGKPRYLLASGIVERNYASDWSKAVKWCCRIDEWGYRPRMPQGGE